MVAGEAETGSATTGVTGDAATGATATGAAATGAAATGAAATGAMVAGCSSIGTSGVEEAAGAVGVRTTLASAEAPLPRVRSLMNSANDSSSGGTKQWKY